MGFNTLVLFKNDCLSDYRNNASAIIDEICNRAGCGEDSETLRRRNVYPYFRDVEIISVHHADDVKVIVAGHNSAYKIHAGFCMDPLYEKKNQIKILKKAIKNLQKEIS